MYDVTAHCMYVVIVSYCHVCVRVVTIRVGHERHVAKDTGAWYPAESKRITVVVEYYMVAVVLGPSSR